MHRNLRHNNAIWTVTCRCVSYFGLLQCNDLTSPTRYCFPSPCVCQRQTSACRTRICACQGETSRASSCTCKWETRYRAQLIDFSARSAFFVYWTNLSCRFRVSIFLCSLRSLAREFIASCKRTRNIRIFTLLWRTYVRRAELNRIAIRSSFAHQLCAQQFICQEAFHMQN